MSAPTPFHCWAPPGLGWCVSHRLTSCLLSLNVPAQVLGWTCSHFSREWDCWSCRRFVFNILGNVSKVAARPTFSQATQAAPAAPGIVLSDRSVLLSVKWQLVVAPLYFPDGSARCFWCLVAVGLSCLSDMPFELLPIFYWGCLPGDGVVREWDIFCIQVLS